MTREEFDREVTSWYELREFCWDNDIDICNDIHDINDLFEIVRGNMSSGQSSYDILCSLQNLIGDVDLEEEYFEIVDGQAYPADDFDDYKHDVAEYYEEHYEWDDDEDEEFYDEEYDEDDEYEEDWYEDEVIPSDVDTEALENLIVG